MAENSKIEWTDHTFNPWVGCTKVSQGCDHCYAEGWAKRAGKAAGVTWGGERRRTSDATWRQPLRWNAQAEREGRRYRVFCASLADVFDNQVPGEWREDLFELIRQTPHLDWLLLTKRPQNIVRMVREHGSIAGNGMRYLPDHVWLGTTCEDQQRADLNIPALLRCPGEIGARVLFLSIEPMLGPIYVEDIPDPAGGVCLKPLSGLRWVGDGQGRCTVRSLGGRIDWVICGGESGPHARPMHPDWARSLRDQCSAAGVPFLFKQWGEWIPMMGHAEGVPVRGEKFKHSDGTYMGLAGKKAAGRLLDGVTHDGFPQAS